MNNWSNDSQTFTQMCILESQNEVKGHKIGILTAENLVLKKEVERLQELIKTLVEGAE